MITAGSVAASIWTTSPLVPFQSSWPLPFRCELTLSIRRYSERRYLQNKRNSEAMKCVTGCVISNNVYCLRLAFLINSVLMDDLKLAFGYNITDYCELIFETRLDFLPLKICNKT